MSFHESELTEEEKSVIDNVVKYAGIPERYNPEISDYIKNHYRNTSEDEWEDFWNLWIKKLKQHPEVYFTATMNHVFGYIDPFYFNNQMQVYQLYNKGSISSTDGEMLYSEYAFSTNLRSATSDGVYIWQNIPICSFVVNPAFYTWVGIILIGALIKKKEWKSILLFVAPLMNVFICFASPVNGFLRYTLPVMAAIPLYFLIAILPYLEEKKYFNISDTFSRNCTLEGFE